MRIHEAILSGKYPNATSLAGMCEVSTKSIYRDLDFMRDRLNLPLEFDPTRNGYYYTEEVGAFPTLQISEGELLALLVAEKALQQYRGTPFERPLMSAFQKMTSSLPETVSINLADWKQSISFHTSAEPIMNLEIMDLLSTTTVQRRQLLLKYRKPGQKEGEDRVVDPYHLANINGEWFLFGYCHLRRDLRTFVPSRILSATPTGKSFVPLKQFSLGRRLRDSFGVHSGADKFQVVVRFSDQVADYIREKKWHPSQQLRELENGGVELSLELSSLVEIQRWILGWGNNALVVAPSCLAEAIRQIARDMASLYEPAALSTAAPVSEEEEKKSPDFDGTTILEKQPLN